MAQFGNGVIWGFDTSALVDGSPSYVDVANIESLSLSGPTVDLLDATVHGEEWRTRVSGLKDGGTATINIRMDANDATHKSIRDNVGVLCAHRFTFPKKVAANAVPFSWANNAIIQNFSISAPHDGLISMSVTLQLSGPPVFTEEAAA